MLTRQQKRKLFDGRKINKLKKNAKKALLKNKTGSKKIKDSKIANLGKGKNPVIRKSKCSVTKNRRGKRQVSLETKAKRVLRSATKKAADDLKVYRVLRSITKLVGENKKGGGVGTSGSRNATAGNFKVIKMEDLFEGFSEEITQWEVIREKADLDLVEKPLEPPEHPRVKLLSRRDVMLYGTVPKMEQRMYSKCKGCNLVFNPRDVLSHKSCVGKGCVVQNIKDLKKNIKDLKKKIQNNKKTHSQTVPSRPIFKKPVSPSPTVNSIICDSKNNIISHIYSSSLKDKDKERDRERDRKKEKEKDREKDKDRDRDRHRDRDRDKDKDRDKDRDRDKEREKEKERSKEKEKVKEAHSDTKEANANSPPANHSSSLQSSKYKKSKKSSNKITKEFDPDVHCGVVEGNKGPCTRSITCSNHRIQLRKLVPGRSKDIHQLISERKAAKEKDMKPSNSSYTPLNLEENEIFCQNTSYVPLVTAIVSIENSGNSPNTTTYVPIMPKTNDMTVQNSSQHSRQTTSINHTSLSTEITTAEPVLIANSKTFENGYNSGGIQTNSQESAIGTVPVVYMPMSPISVVSPVQFVKIGKNMICLESPQSAMSPPLPTNQSVYFTIPEQNNVKMYKTRPKPVTVPSFGTRRVGGAILLSNQRLESQRNDILMAINSKSKTNAQQGYKTVSLLNNAPHRPNILKVRSLSRVNCKRPAADKVNSSDNKQSRSAPDVNGFILHADMSETADAPQPNHCIQEKIALLNMK